MISFSKHSFLGKLFGEDKAKELDRVEKEHERIQVQKNRALDSLLDQHQHAMAEVARLYCEETCDSCDEILVADVEKFAKEHQVAEADIEELCNLVKELKDDA